VSGARQAQPSLGVVGLSWRQANAEQLAQFTLPRDGRTQRLRELANALQVGELLYLATCNRVEVLFAGSAAISVAERRERLERFFGVSASARFAASTRALRAWADEGAVEHLYLVASGLDSARAGESEIVGQLKAAAAEAEAASLLGHSLRNLVQDALLVAKRVRPVADGHIGRASLADIALERVAERLRAQPGAVALIGASPMIAHCATALATSAVPLVLVNRSVHRALELATSFALSPEVRSLDAFRLAPDVVSAVIIATAAPDPIFSALDCNRIAERGSAGIPPLVVDLSVPAALREHDALDAGMEYLGMDAITKAAAAQRDDALDSLSAARALVDAALDERRRRAWTALVDPTIVALRLRYADRTERELERALGAELGSLDETQRAALRDWAVGLSHQLAHVPSRGLRDLAASVGPEAAAEFLGAAAPDLAKDLRARIG